MMKRWTPWMAEEVPAPNSGILFHNNRYHVIRRVYAPREGRSPVIHLSIRNNDRSAKHDWRDFQRIKNELVGHEIEMVEIYPRESHKVDLSNQFHLWGYLSDAAPFAEMGFGWEEGQKLWDGRPENRPDHPGWDNAVQRPITEE